jgi:hydrogenase 3 maturation protease
LSLRSVESELTEWFGSAEKVAIVGVGNELRRDDFVGVAVVKSLRGQLSKERVLLIESETVPESFLGEISEFSPSHVLVVDAGLLGIEEGSIQFVREAGGYLSSHGAISTHTLPIRIFCEYLEKMVGAEVGIVLIQPERTDFGEELTESVSRAAKKLAAMLVKAIPK